MFSFQSISLNTILTPAFIIIFKVVLCASNTTPLLLPAASSSSLKLLENFVFSGHSMDSSSVLVAFLVQLVNQHFSKCSLLLLQDNLEKGLRPDHRANPILENTNVPKFMVNFKNDTGSAPEQDVYSSAYTPPVTFPPPPRLTNVRRYSDQCMISAMMINQVSEEFTNRIVEVISPTFHPMTRKDMDYYIFVADPQVQEDLMRMRVFGSKLKFKLAMGLNRQKKLEVNTIDFFGGVNGSPIMFPLLSTGAMPPEREDIFPDFIVNMRGHTIQITIPLSLSLVEANPRFGGPWVGVNNGKRGRWKYVIEDYLAIKYNFTYRFFPATGPDGREGHGGTGRQLVNGTWIGVTGDLYYGRADLGLGIANTDHRILVISFTDQLFDLAYLTFVTGHPSKVYSTLAMLWPFDIDLWLALIFGTAAVSAFFYVVTRIMQHIHEEEAVLSNCFTQILIIVAPYLEQDSPINPVSTPLRAFMALWSFFIMIITTLYRSKLVTLLAFPVLEVIPNTFDGLAFSDLTVGFMKVGDASYNTLTRSKEEVYLRLTRRWEVMPGPSLECLEKVVNQHRYACILYDFDVVYLSERNMTSTDTRKLKYSSARTYNVWIALATAPQSIYRVNFGRTMAPIMPFDLATTWNRMDLYHNVRVPKLRWWDSTNQTAEKTKREEPQGDDSDLTLNNIKGVFYIYLCCSALSLIVYFFEICHCPLQCCKRKDKLIQIQQTPT